jgi:LTXXQ motif family protein
MSKLSRALAITLLAASVPAGIALAQQTPEPKGPAAEDSDGPRGPSPEIEARLEDGRIAMAKTALKLSPEQEKLWAPVEEKIRAGYAERQKAREQWRAKREERWSKRDEYKKLTLPERIEKRSESMASRATKMNERATKLKEFADVVKPLYASLSDEQKQIADQLLRRFSHGGHGHHGFGHRRWAMGGPGMGHGMMGHHGMGPHDGHGMMGHGGPAPDGDGPPDEQ